MSDRLTGRAGLTRAGLEALMLKSIRWSLFKVGIAVFCFVGVMWACLAYFFPAPPSTITIAAGLKGGAFEDLAYRYQERLARSRVKLIVRLTDGMLDNFRLVEDRSSGVDVAFIFGGVSNRKKSPDLVSLGRIYFAPIWFFYRGTETLDRLSQLKGKRIAVGPASRVVMDPLLAANGVNHASATIVSLVGSDAAKALQEGSIDVGLPPEKWSSLK